MSLIGKSVLVVEDDEDLRQLIERVFVAEGFRVRAAGDGMAALHLVKEESPDLMVLDLMLPWINGIAVLRTVRQQPHLAAVPVVVTTGTATSAYDLRSFAPIHVMHKPLDVDNLVGVARKLLETR